VTTRVAVPSHGTSIFAGAFDIEGGCGTAVNSANAINCNQLMLASLGLDPSLGARHECIPVGKISNMTSDTTNLMPATAMELKDNYCLFKGIMWTTCFAHSIGLDIIVPNNQPAIVPLIRRLRRHAVQIASIIRRGAANELVATCVPDCICWCSRDACANKLIILV
jgi:hypothetical protein